MPLYRPHALLPVSRGVALRLILNRRDAELRALQEALACTEAGLETIELSQNPPRVQSICPVV